MAIATASTSTATSSSERHHYESVCSEETAADLASSSSGLPEKPLPTVAAGPAWQPLYLRRTVLLAFAAVFAAAVAALEAILVVSDRNRGLATSRTSLRFVWTYGPTALLTAVAALWARLEYQAKLVAPWLRLARPAEPVSATLLLDYVSPLVPVVVVRAGRRRDFAVLLATTVSLLLKVLVLLSTGLLSLSSTAMSRDALSMTLLNRFVDDGARLGDSGSVASYIMRGLAADNLTLPDGLSSDYAFPSVHTHLPDTTQTRVTADGLTSSLDCSPADIHLLSDTTVLSFTLRVHLNVTSPACNASAVRLDSVPWTQGSNWTIAARFKEIQCDGMSGDAGRRVLVLFANVSITEGDQVDAHAHAIHRSTQLLCVPTYAIHPVAVTRNATQIMAVEPVSGAPDRTLDNVTAWDIMEAQFRRTVATIGIASRDSDRATDIYAVSVDTDDYVLSQLGDQFVQGPEAEALFDESFLQRTATGYYRQIAAIVARYSLMQPAALPTKGSATIYENRLHVSFWVAQSMALLAAVCLLLAGAILSHVPAKGFLSQNPSTLLGMASLSRHSHVLVDRLCRAGAADEKQMAALLEPSTFQSRLVADPATGQTQFCIIEEAPQTSTREEEEQNEKREEPIQPTQGTFEPYQPIVLRPVVRTLLCLVAVGLIVTLELLLHRSHLQQGLADVTDNWYIHYTWTTIPALVFGLLAMLVSSVDFNIRSLAPYMKLEQSVTRPVFPQLEFLDMTVPVAMYREMRLGMLWALATTTAILIASLYTTISASLFEASLLPTTAAISLRANQSFESAINSDLQVASLILASNYSFPRFTYQNLAFPQFVSATDLSKIADFDASTASISAVVPALRVKMDCTVYSPAHITADVTSTSSLSIRIADEDCYGDVELLEQDLTPDMTYFGSTLILGSCSNLVAIWGKVNVSADADADADAVLQNIAAVGCNVTLEAVDVTTTFVGAGLDLDSQNLPQPIESTARNTSLPSWVDYFADIQTGIYSDLAQVDVYPQSLDAFFAMLVTSPWAIPLSDLGDPDAADGVGAAIQSQVGLIHAQILDQNRGPAAEANATTIGTASAGHSDAQPRYPATATDANGRRRLVQDAVSTHVLAAMLGATLLLVGIGWATSPRPGVLPRPPTTIASAVALLAGGNLPGQLPADAQWRPLEEVTAAVGDPETRFSMGWWTGQEESAGGIKDGTLQFGIFSDKRL